MFPFVVPLVRYRTRHRKNVKHGSIDGNISTYSSLTPEEQAELSAVTKSAQAKLMARSGAGMLALSTPDTVSSTNKLPRSVCVCYPMGLQQKGYLWPTIKSVLSQFENH